MVGRDNFLSAEAKLSIPDLSNYRIVENWWRKLQETVKKTHKTL